MKSFDGMLICTDLDGTLLKNDGTISKENTLSRMADVFLLSQEGCLSLFLIFIMSLIPMLPSVA